MKWSKKSIAEWSEKTFPILDLVQQYHKADLEAREFFDAVESGDTIASLEELADVYITQAILAFRFGKKSGLLFCTLIEAQDELNKPYEKVMDAVDVKMDINASRTWALINGEYRHVD